MEDNRVFQPPKELRYFLGTFKEALDKSFFLFPTYFVNNTDDFVDELAVLTKAGLKSLKPWATLSDITGPVVDNILIRRFIEIAPKSSIKICDLFHSEFIWKIERLIFLRSGGKEEHLHFSFPEGFLASAPLLDNIPILNRSGWICEGRSHGF